MSDGMIVLAMLLTVSPSRRAVLTQVIATQTTQEISPLNISITLPPQKLSLGSDLKVLMTVTNTSGIPVTTELPRVKHSEYYGFRFVLSCNGANVPKTSFYKTISHEDGASDPEAPGIFNSDDYTMRPGKVDHIVIALNKLFIIQASGIYTLYVEMLPNMDIKTPIHSQPITFSIGQ